MRSAPTSISIGISGDSGSGVSSTCSRTWKGLRGQLLDGYHQAGTTRMSDRPEDGVLNPQLAVHGFEDLFVASSSAFVTSGQANSTFMILVLALRLADHLDRGLRRDRG